MIWDLRLGSCVDVLASLPAASVQCVVTSPPYWGLRDYGTATWVGGDPACSHFKLMGGTARSGLGSVEQAIKAVTRSSVPFRERCGLCGAVRVDEQLGLESTPEAYVAALVEVFRGVRRVLRDDGVLWLNIGDSYISNATGSITDTSTLEGGGKTQLAALTRPDKRANGLKAKDLVGIPWMVAFALRADGWYLRSDVIWAKPSCMPESVMDRPTKAHEYVFLLTKSAQYHYDVDAIREPGTGRTDPITSFGRPPDRNDGGRVYTLDGLVGANARSVWSINPEASPYEHFAVMPKALARRCILAGTSAHGECPACGAPWVRVIEKGESDYARLKREEGITWRDTLADEEGKALTSNRQHIGNVRNAEGNCFPYVAASREHKGWEPTCACKAGEPIPQAVLDPFAGVATTGVVALEEGRSFVGIELSAKYHAMGRERLAATMPLFATEAVDTAGGKEQETR